MESSRALLVLNLAPAAATRGSAPAAAAAAEAAAAAAVADEDQHMTFAAGELRMNRDFMEFMRKHYSHLNLEQFGRRPDYHRC